MYFVFRAQRYPFLQETPTQKSLILISIPHCLYQKWMNTKNKYLFQKNYLSENKTIGYSAKKNS
jgi:hypothetical protein